MTTAIRLLIAASLLALLAAPAAAEPYVFGSVGVSRTDAAGMQKSTMPLAAGAGYRFSRNLGIEGAYINIDANSQQSQSSQSQAGSIRTDTTKEWSGKGLGLFAVGAAPISGSLSLVGRVGAYRLKSRTQTRTLITDLSTLPATGLETTSSASENFWAPTVGIGVRYVPDGSKGSLQILLEQIHGKGDMENARMLTVGVGYSF